jgi:voltage-gated potassium channel
MFTRPLDALHAAFHRPGTPGHRAVEAVVWTLIVASIGLVVADLARGAGPRDALGTADRAILAVFWVEVTLRVLTFRPRELEVFGRSPAWRTWMQVWGRVRFALTPLMLIDLLTVLAVLPALRGLRVLRALRLFRGLKVFRYSHPFQGVARAFVENRFLFVGALSIVGLIVLLGGVTIVAVESEENEKLRTLADGFWWTIVTLTTVGFGDITPVTPVGRLVAGVIMILGMFTLALFAGIVGSTLLTAVLTVREEQFRMSGISGHVVICGYSANTHMLLDAVLHEVDPEEREIVLFTPGDRPPGIPPEFAWVSGEPTKESELDKARLTHAHTVIVVASRSEEPQLADARTILTVFTIRRYLGRSAAAATRQRPLRVIAEILEEENVEHARAAGADEVIETTRMGFSLLAHAVSVPGAATLLSHIVAAGAHNVYVGVVPEEIVLPASFADVAAQLKARTGALAIGVRDDDAGDRVNPPADFQLARGDRLIYLAERPLLVE